MHMHIQEEEVTSVCHRNKTNRMHVNTKNKRKTKAECVTETRHCEYMRGLNMQGHEEDEPPCICQREVRRSMCPFMMAVPKLSKKRHRTSLPQTHQGIVCMCSVTSPHRAHELRSDSAMRILFRTDSHLGGSYMHRRTLEAPTCIDAPGNRVCLHSNPQIEFIIEARILFQRCAYFLVMSPKSCSSTQVYAVHNKVLRPLPREILHTIHTLSMFSAGDCRKRGHTGFLQHLQVDLKQADQPSWRCIIKILFSSVLP